MPSNGICIFAGLATDDQNREKKSVISVEPPYPLKSSRYICDGCFHTEILAEMLEPREKYGFIVISGNECVLATLAGDDRIIHQRFHVDIPKKMTMGGQSAERFQRQRENSRKTYRVLIGEAARRWFITGGKPNITGIILAGAAQLKDEVANSMVLGDKLSPLVIKVIDVCYGGREGLNQAIAMSASFLQEVTHLREVQELDRFFTAVGEGKPVALGVDEVMEAWSANAIGTVYINKDCKLVRRIVDDCVVFDKNDVADGTELVEWIVDNYEAAGYKLMLVGSDSPEGAQLAKGFGGVGAILRFAMPFTRCHPSDEEEFDLDDDFECIF